jgi:hypothetical protein
MTRTISTDVFDPEILTDAVQGVFAQKTAFMGSLLAAAGAVIVSGSMPTGGPKAVGQTIKVPYFGVIGEFASNAESSSGNFMSAITPVALKQTSEQATITRDSLSFEVSVWAEGNALVNPAVGDPYQEAARQLLESAQRKMDKRIIDAAAAAGVYVKDVYSATTPKTLDWDTVVQAKFSGWGDEQDDIVGLLVHSHTQKDLQLLKDGIGRPLLNDSEVNGSTVQKFNNIPVIVSDRVPVTGSAMGAITSSGTAPPVATLVGTPLGPFNLVIDAQTGDATTITFKFSTDGGNTWSAILTAHDDSVAVALTDTAIDSTVGVNGATGLTVAFASGTFNADNLYTSTASLKVMSMLVKRRALAFWYASGHLTLKTAQDILADSDLAAMHLYAAAYRYRRIAMGTKPGIVQITHNVSGY